MSTTTIGAIAAATRNHPGMRAHERAPIAVAVSMESENNFYAGITDNISEGGVFVATLTPPPVGAEIEMELSLPNYERPFHVKGFVCWIRDLQVSSEGAPAGCGLRWLEMSRDALGAIHNFILGRDTILFDAD